ncbi:hypothetical protein ACLKA6_004547 [Drosophila palustris]
MSEINRLMARRRILNSRIQQLQEPGDHVRPAAPSVAAPVAAAASGAAAPAVAAPAAAAAAVAAPANQH